MMQSLWKCVDRSLDWYISLWYNIDNLKGQCSRSKLSHWSKKNRGWNSNFFIPYHDISPWSEKTGAQLKTSYDPCTIPSMLNHKVNILCASQFTYILESTMIVRSLSFLLLLFLTPLVSSKDDLTKKTVGTSGRRKSLRRKAFSF